MIPRRLLFPPLLLLLLAGCGSIRYELPGHSYRAHTAAVMLHVGDTPTALSTPRRLPVPGGFELGLASEDPAIVSVDYTPRSGGAATTRLVAHAPGATRVHYVNRYNFPADPADPAGRERLRQEFPDSFLVTVAP